MEKRLEIDHSFIFDDFSPTERAILLNARKKAFNKSRKCLNPTCSKIVKAHNNHLLQKRKSLENISENGKIYRFELGVFHDDGLVFEKKGLNDAFKFNGLCPTCDDRIFSIIEKRVPDFSDAKSACLYSLRTHFWEIRKQHIRLDESSYLSVSPLNIKLEKHIKAVDLNTFQKLDFLLFYLEAYLQPEKQIYKYRFLPNLGLACSASVGINSWQHFVHIIPFEGKTCILMSTDKDNASLPLGNSWIDDYVPKQLFLNLETLDEVKLQKYISDFLLRYAEDWIVSSTFYNSYILPRKAKVIEEIKKGIAIEYKFPKYWDDPNFNLFDTTT